MNRLLVIDDSPFIAKEIANILAGHDFEIVGHARNGETGIEMYQELKPDVVTLDIIMPGIDGIETAKEILKFDAAAKIIMLSSLCDHDTMAEIEEIGLKTLLAKPIDPEQLLEKLNEMIE